MQTNVNKYSFIHYKDNYKALPQMGLLRSAPNPMVVK